MTKVYIVTEGQYDDYGIVGVFDENHEQEAIVLMKHRNELSFYNYATVEEYELNPQCETTGERMAILGFGVYDVIMSIDGSKSSVVKRLRHKDQAVYFRVNKQQLVDTSNIGPMGQYGTKQSEHETVYAIVWAKSEEHAIQIVNEKRILWITNGYEQEK